MNIRSNVTELIECEVRQLSKNCRTSYPVSVNEKNQVSFVLIHREVWFALLISISNHPYFVSFIDDAPKCTWVYVMKCRDELLISA